MARNTISMVDISTALAKDKCGISTCPTVTGGTVLTTTGQTYFWLIRVTTDIVGRPGSGRVKLGRGPNTSAAE